MPRRVRCMARWARPRPAGAAPTTRMAGTRWCCGSRSAAPAQQQAGDAGGILGLFQDGMALFHRGARHVATRLLAQQQHFKNIAGCKPVEREADSHECHWANFHA